MLLFTLLLPWFLCSEFYSTRVLGVPRTEEEAHVFGPVQVVLRSMGLTLAGGVPPSKSWSMPPGPTERGVFVIP